MTPEDRLTDLMLQWEAGRRGGRVESVSHVCRKFPELAGELARRIEIVESVEILLGMDHGMSVSGAVTVSLESGASVPPPVEIPGYELQGILNQGGMGIVYRARQISLARIVAVKMMMGSHPSGSALSRFQTECRAIAHLHHPNLVEVFEFGETAAGPYFSMELVEGGNLTERMQSDPPGFQEAALLVESIAKVVHVVHERGIIHRDLKPANILLTEEGIPKVADFGLAKLLDQESGHSRTGELLGTLTYMAPEQIDSSFGAVGTRSDVYGLGAVLYELLTGQPPFQSSRTHLLRQVLEDDPRAPSTLRSAVPKELEAISLKCLEKRPGSRYASAQEIAEELRSFLEGRPVRARPVGPIQRTAKVVRRRPELKMLLCVALLVLVAAPIAAIVIRMQRAAELHTDALQCAPLVHDVLKRNCFACHGQDRNRIEGGLDILNHQALLDSRRRMIVPGAPEDSRLIQRIADGSMPPEHLEMTRPPIAQKELSILERWIRGGAPKFSVTGQADTPRQRTAFSKSAADVKKIFVQRCYECHKHGVARGGIRILHHRLLVNIRKVVVPGRPDESELLQLLLTESRRVMPPPPRTRLTDAEVSVIRQWITDGASPFPGSSGQ